MAETILVTVTCVRHRRRVHYDQDAGWLRHDRDRSPCSSEQFTVLEKREANRQTAYAVLLKPPQPERDSDTQPDPRIDAVAAEHGQEYESGLGSDRP
jgi:hypothetical protein